MKLLSVVLILEFIAEISAIDSRIVGGVAVDITQFPYMASVQRSTGRTTSHICGGSIIAANVVLTAAHCLTPFIENSFSRVSPSDLVVYAGMTRIKTKEKHQKRGVRQVIVHPFYVPLMYFNDIGMLKLSKPFDLDMTVLPVQLAKKNTFDGLELSTLYSVRKCIVTGWGLKHYQSTDTVDELRSVSISLIDNKQCESLLAELGMFSTVLDSQFCTMEIAKDACQGDSGGPLLCNGTQVGIVSYGKECGSYLMPSIWTRVDKMTDWIDRNLNVETRASGVNRAVATILFLPIITQN